MTNAKVENYLGLLSGRVYDGEVVFKIADSFYGIGEEGDRAIIAIHEKRPFKEKYVFSLSPHYLKKNDLNHLLLICRPDEVAFKIPMETYNSLILDRQSVNRPIFKVTCFEGVWKLEGKYSSINIDEYKFDLSFGKRNWIRTHTENTFILKTTLQSQNRYPVNS